MHDHAPTIWTGITMQAAAALKSLQPHLRRYTVPEHPDVEVCYVGSRVLVDPEAGAGPNAYLIDFAREWDGVTYEDVIRVWESAQWIAALNIVANASSPEDAREHQIEAPPARLLLDWVLEDFRVEAAIRLGGRDCDPVAVLSGMYQRHQQELVQAAIYHCGTELEEPPYDMTDEEHDEYCRAWRRVVDSS